MLTRLHRALAIAFFGFLVTACATVPITGRTQLNMVSDQQLVSAADLGFSKFMGKVGQKKLSRSESPQAPAILDMVSRVSDRVIEAAGLAGKYRWETVVVKSDAANAFVLPNGKIVVFTGLLSVAKTEGEGAEGAAFARSMRPGRSASYPRRLAVTSTGAPLLLREDSCDDYLDTHRLLGHSDGSRERGIPAPDVPCGFFHPTDFQ
jgi:Peptidase family M48